MSPLPTGCPRIALIMDCLLLLGKKVVVQAYNGEIFLPFLIAQAVDHQGARISRPSAAFVSFKECCHLPQIGLVHPRIPGAKQDSMLAGFKDGGVETIGYVAAVGITIAQFDRVRICSVGPDALSKMLVEGRNGVVIFRGIGVPQLIKPPASGTKESRAMWLVV